MAFWFREGRAGRHAVLAGLDSGCRPFPGPQTGLMPYVNVKITRDGVTKSQKERLVRDITSTLVETLGKKPEHIHIVIDEIDPENWGFAGMLTTEYRKKPS